MNIYIQPYIEMSKKENWRNGDATLLYYHPIKVQINQYITMYIHLDHHPIYRVYK